MLSYFLGMEVHKLDNGDMLLTHQNYIRELLVKAKLD